MPVKEELYTVGNRSFAASGQLYALGLESVSRKVYTRNTVIN